MAASSSSGGGSGGVDFVSSSSSSTGTGGNCEFSTTFVVEVPPEGVPADPGVICAVSVEPVQSNQAARVTLVKEQALHLATGFIEVAPALASLVEGLPIIEVIDAQAPELLGMQVSQVAPVAGGFSFHAEWPQPLDLPPESWVRMTLRTTLEVAACGPMVGRTVQAITHVHLCSEPPDVAWVSSGDSCNVCDIIAEMAPSPIVPDAPGDDLPLGRVLSLRVTPLARIGSTLVLLAEHDGGPSSSCAWHPSAGDLVALAPDVVVWTPPASRGPHLLQAAVHGDDAAAVASFTWPEVA
jgi:hypothetical protein